jgi:hypothetical protein
MTFRAAEAKRNRWGWQPSRQRRGSDRENANRLMGRVRASRIGAVPRLRAWAFLRKHRSRGGGDSQPDMATVMIARHCEFIGRFARPIRGLAAVNALQHFCMNFDGLLQGHFHDAHPQTQQPYSTISYFSFDYNSTDRCDVPISVEPPTKSPEFSANSMICVMDDYAHRPRLGSLQ